MSIRQILRRAAAVATIFASHPVAAQDGPIPFDAVPTEAASPFGGMAISPTRVILHTGSAGQQVTLYNSGGAPVTYRVEGVDMGLDEKGDYIPLEEGADIPWSALPHLRFSPRQVTLQPGERQSIRIIARAPRDLPTGEYRSHLRFSSIPLVETPAPEGQEAAQAERTTVSVSVALDYRITIPVLLRSGRPAGGSVIEAVSPHVTPQGRAQLEVAVRRTGQRSDYGTLRAYDRDGKEVGTVAGISVLPPSDIRIVPLPLEEGARAVRIIYEEELPGRKSGQILAEYLLP